MARNLNGTSQYALVNSIDFSQAGTAVVTLWFILTQAIAARAVLFEYANVVGGVGGIGFDIVLGNPDNTHGIIQSYNGNLTWADTFLIADIFGLQPVVGTWVGITASYNGGHANSLYSNRAHSAVVSLNAGTHQAWTANWSANAQFSVGARVPTPASLFLNGQIAEPSVRIGTTMASVPGNGLLQGAPWPQQLDGDIMRFYAPLRGDPSPEPDLSPSHKPITLVGAPPVSRHPGGAPYLMLPGYA